MKLYKSLKTYTDLPRDGMGQPVYEKIKAYVDTADEGDDYLAAGLYLLYQGSAYLLDVYYTQDGMETTESELARRLVQHRVNLAEIESNSGGRGFARNVQRILQEWGASGVIVSWFHQSKNKNSRILSQSSNVPVDWATRWPVFYEHVTNYQKAGKHKHDDAEDMLTGIAERLGRRLMWG
jgi:predicted phage terminase large subunit-like protein